MLPEKLKLSPRACSPSEFFCCDVVISLIKSNYHLGRVARSPTVVVASAVYAGLTTLSMLGLTVNAVMDDKKFQQLEKSVRETREQVTLGEVARNMEALLHDPTYENVKIALKMEFEVCFSKN